MSEARHYVTAFVLLMVIANLYLVAWNGIKQGYDITEVLDDDGTNVMERLSGLSFIEKANEFSAAISKLTAPSNVFDILGSLASAGLGILQIIGSVITFPFEIINALAGYTFIIPEIVLTMLGIMVATYMGFIILSAYLKWRV